MLAIVDSGPLYAIVDGSDDDHEACIELFRRNDLDLIIPTLVVGEVCYLILP